MKDKMHFSAKIFGNVFQMFLGRIIKKRMKFQIIGADLLLSLHL